MSFASFVSNITLTGSVAPARAYIEELLPDVLEGTVERGRVFDRTVGLDKVPDGYRVMAAAWRRRSSSSFDDTMKGHPIVPGTITLLKLNNGVEMPALGLGVFQSTPQETVPAVEAAINNGYRLIDTAAAYGNEKQVGEGIRRAGIDRDDIFVITKLWLTDFGYDSALRAFDTSLGNLRLDYLDLYLLHWPVPSAWDATVASYQAVEKLLADGRVRAIGVSNHTPQHLTNLMQRTDVVPAVDQVELHPHFIQRELREFDAQHAIITQPWSRLGGVNRYWVGNPNADKDPLQEPVVTQLAAKYGKTPAQVILRWHIEHGLCAIPKSVKAHRIAENIDIVDFTLTQEEVAAIDALDTGVRSGPDPNDVRRDSFS